MKLLMAALCDRATIREGLLHILGGGVTQCSLNLPCPPDLDLAVLVRAENWHEVAGHHALTTTVTHESGQLAGTVHMFWDAPKLAADSGPLPQLPVVVPIRGMTLANDGDYSVRVEVDQVELITISFTVTKADLPGVTVQIR
ncbi:hypothetical protein PV569_13015 [Streptomyces scabiei]|uniref:DUF6941 family protein n=1 Tax=Streptomyces scabiei TaxID=1930 RepID=UPI0029AA2BD0|nr:hypothetical protein [Streptomyces scabiei]MDX3294627.1 hypothetical protein [Streptomyces scabiei]